MTNHKDSTRIKRLCCTALMISLAGCNSIFPKIESNISDEDMRQFYVSMRMHDISPANLESIPWRKNYVSMKMYEIDKSYEAYWHDIDTDDVFISFGGDIALLGLTTAATAIPVAQTTKVLAAAATAVGSSKTSYKQEFMLAKTKEAIRLQADKNRISVGKTIRARLNCSPSAYPWGMVLSDIDSYKNAGTFEAALNSIAQSVSASEPAANASTGKASPVTVSTTPTLPSPAGGGGAAKLNGAAQSPDKGSIPIAGGKLEISYTPDSTCPLVSSKGGK